MDFQLTSASSALNLLEDVNQVVVSQKVEFAEVLTGFETANRYELKRTDGRRLMFAAETGGDMITRHCLKSARPFSISLLAPSGGDFVAKFKRPCRCQMCPWAGCCLNLLDVESPVGVHVGGLRQTITSWPFAGPRFEVCDERDVPQLLIKGPPCAAGRVKYNITALDGCTNLGVIEKQWGGLLKEMFTAADTFSVSFPDSLTKEMKVVLIGACFLIDFMFFERHG